MLHPTIVKVAKCHNRSALANTYNIILHLSPKLFQLIFDWGGRDGGEGLDILPTAAVVIVCINTGTLYLL